jgi:hypothetical protein
MENKKVCFTEVMYTSSQKGIVSRMPGFQVRTHSSDLDNDLINILERKEIFGYQLPDDRRVNLSQLKQNPRVVLDYPRTFIYKKISADSGDKYVFVRTVYIGIDYGYFCGINAYQRTGSNYFTHVLLFEEEPPREIFNILLQNNSFNNNIFRPIDYTCSPDNKELTMLLTGDPSYLPANSFEITEPIQIPDLADYMGDVISGIVQQYISHKKSDGKRLIIKIRNNITEVTAGTIKLFLPRAMVQRLSFATNHLKDGVPDDLDIVFVNEFYTGMLYEEDYICIDLFTGNHTGLENNIIYDRIREYVTSKDSQTLIALLDYLTKVNLSESTDYNFLFNIFILIESDKEVLAADLNLDFFKKLSSTSLLEDNHKAVWEKVNSCINNGLLSNEGQDIIQIITLIKNIDACDLGQNKEISEISKSRLTQVLFGSDKYFAKIVNAENANLVSEIIRPDEIQSIENVFYSLRTSNDIAVWKTFISKCTNPSEREDYSDLIISNIIESPLPQESINMLLFHLYPVSDSGRRIFHKFFTSYPEQISKMRKITEEICMSGTYEQLAGLVVKAGNDALGVFASIVDKYFTQKAETIDRLHCFADFIKFIDIVTVDTFNQFKAGSLLNGFAKSIYQNPSDKDRDLIARLLVLNVKMGKETQDLFSSMLSVMKGEIPKSVNTDTMVFVYRLQKNDVLKKMFNTWLNQGLNGDNLKTFIKKCNRLVKTPDIIECMLTTVWKSQSNRIKSNREEFIRIIIQNVKWDKNDRDKFVKTCFDGNLATLITKSSCFLNKVFNLLFGKK